MQIRLDPDIARTIKRNADAHRHLFKRRKSYAAFVNEELRNVFSKRPWSEGGRLLSKEESAIIGKML